jgi:hypothetical protein
MCSQSERSSSLLNNALTTTQRRGEEGEEAELQPRRRCLIVSACARYTPVLREARGAERYNTGNHVVEHSDHMQRE